MAGRPGQISQKPKFLPDSYDPKILNGLDKRSRVAKLLHARFDQLAVDQGGLEALSYAHRSLCWRFLFVEAWLETQERTLSEGGTIDEARYFSALNSYTGLLGRLGLKRRPRPVVPLSEYLKRKPPEEPSA